MRIFDPDFFVTEGLDCPSARAPLVRLDKAPDINFHKLSEKKSDKEIFTAFLINGIRRSRYFFTLEEFNMVLLEEIELFKRGQDGKLKLYSLRGIFPYFNFYVEDEGVEYVVELSFLPEDNRPDWVLYYNYVHSSSWSEGTFVVIKK